MSTRYESNSYQHFNKTGAFFSNQQPNKFSQMRGKQGDTWDAKHMTKFLSQSNYSNWKQPNSTSLSKKSTRHQRAFSTGDHFFKTTKDNKNTSKIGFTKINPFVSSAKVDTFKADKISNCLNAQPPKRYQLSDHKMRLSGNFRFQGNSVKFRKTDPLTLQHLKLKNLAGHEKERLLGLITKRHPHGLTGIDHPQNPETRFYQCRTEKIRIRVEPNSHRSFVLDREWKSRRKVSQQYKQQYGFEKGKVTTERKFNNDDQHGFNIITNRKTRRKL